MLPGNRSYDPVCRHSGAVAVGFMPKVGEPPAHLEVHCLGTDYGLLRERPVPRHEHERYDCVPPRPPCEPTSSSKAATSPVSGQ
jgi:hypothetical protein